MVLLVYLAGTGWLAGAIDTDTDTGGTASVLGRGVGGRRVLVAAGVRQLGLSSPVANIMMIMIVDGDNDYETSALRSFS